MPYYAWDPNLENYPYEPRVPHDPRQSLLHMGVRIRGTLGDIDPLNKVPFKRARSRVQKGSLLRGLPNTT